MSLLAGHVKGGRKELDAEAVRRLGHGPGHHQAVFPRWWSGFEKGIPGQEPRAAISQIRSVSVHADYRLTHQDVRQITTVAR